MMSAMIRKALLLPVLLVTTVVPAGSTRPDFPWTEQELKVQAGYYTDDGKYLGGIPSHDDELKYYECLEFNDVNSTEVDATAAASATVCTSWQANEAGSDEFEVGICKCKFVTNDKYCDSWTCSQLEVNNCESDSSSCFQENEKEAMRCSCETEDESGEFCAFWTCVDTDADGNQEFEEYTCSRPSTSGLYCEAWTGEIQGVEEVEMTACECVEEWNGDAVCSYWECEEQGMNKCSTRDSWCNLGVSVGVGGGFGFIGVLALCAVVLGFSDGDIKSCDSLGCACFWCVWIAGWAIGVVIWGGQDGATYVGIWWGFFCILALMWLCCSVGRRKSRPSV